MSTSLENALLSCRKTLLFKGVGRKCEHRKKNAGCKLKSLAEVVGTPSPLAFAGLLAMFGFLLAQKELKQSQIF